MTESSAPRKRDDTMTLILLTIRLALVGTFCDGRDLDSSEYEEGVAYCAEHVISGDFDDKLACDAIPASEECSQF